MRKIRVKDLWRSLWSVLRSWFRNPMLAKELNSQTRGWRSPLTIMVYLGVLGGVGLAYYLIITAPMKMNGYMDTMMGMRIYVLLAVFQILLIGLMTPALTAGAISGERERQTLDLLLCTRLSAGRIVLGKLLASISYEVLLIGASLPMFALVFLFGGVAPMDLVKAFGVYLMTAITFGAVGVFCSTVFRRTQVATVITYGIVFFLLFGTIVGGLVATRSGYNNGYPNGNSGFSLMYYTNPLVALMLVMPGNAWQYVPFIPGQVMRVYAPAVSAKALSSISPSSYPAQPSPPRVGAVWGFVAFGTGLTILCLVAAAYLVNPSHRRFAWRRVFRGTWSRLSNVRSARANRVEVSKSAGGPPL